MKKIFLYNTGLLESLALGILTPLEIEILERQLIDNPKEHAHYVELQLILQHFAMHKSLFVRSDLRDSILIRVQMKGSTNTQRTKKYRNNLKVGIL